MHVRYRIENGCQPSNYLGILQTTHAKSSKKIHVFARPNKYVKRLRNGKAFSIQSRCSDSNDVKGHRYGDKDMFGRVRELVFITIWTRSRTPKSKDVPSSLILKRTNAGPNPSEPRYSACSQRLVFDRSNLGYGLPCSSSNRGREIEFVCISSCHRFILFTSTISSYLNSSTSQT